MKWIVRYIKWIMLVAGLSTASIFLYALRPQASLQSSFGQTLDGPLGDVMVRNWAVMVGLLGVMLIYGAFDPPARRFILTIVGLGKAFFVVIMVTAGAVFLGQTIRFGVIVDGLEVLFFAAYLLATKSPQGARMKSLAVVVAALALATAATPCIAQSAVPSDLRAAMQRRYLAIVRADVPTWDGLTAEDFTLVAGDGSVLTKAQRIAAMKAQQPDTTSATQVPKETVHVFGNAATERYDGGDAWVQIVWAKDATGWRAHSAQVTPVSPDSAAVRKAIDDNTARFADNFKRGDAAAVTAVYTSDAVLMVSNVPAWEGSEGIRQGLTGFFAQFSIPSVKIVTHDVVISGVRAIERGTYEWTLHPKTGTGPDITDHGKYLTVWEEQGDGSWKILRDISNSDRPGPM
jgi:ketosteroid isomerase-like protein